MTRQMNRFIPILVLVLLTGSIVLVQAQNGPRDSALLSIAKTGQVLRTTKTAAIYWGSQWSDSAFAGDVITGIDAFLAGFGGSDFAAIATEYYDRTGPITALSSYAGHTIDPSGLPSEAGAVGEACRMAGDAPDPNGVYFVFLPTPSPSGSCSIHVWGTCGGRRAPIQVISVPQMSGEAGDTCPPPEGDTTGHSPRLASYAKALANQLLATITNPRGSGWTDKSGRDMAPKCQGVFPPLGVNQIFSNGTEWRLRAQWSNAAYLQGSGLPNTDGQHGCVY